MKRRRSHPTRGCRICRAYRRETVCIVERGRCALPSVSVNVLVTPSQAIRTITYLALNFFEIRDIEVNITEWSMHRFERFRREIPGNALSLDIIE